MTTTSGWQVGDQFSAVVVENLTRSQIVQYAGASGDFNPIHTDEVFATEVAGLPSVFAHGLLTMGACGGFLQGLAGSLRRYTARFVEKVWPGDTLTATATVTSVEPGSGQLAVELEVSVTNQNGAVVLSGSAQADVPPDSSPASDSSPTRSEFVRA